MNKRCRRRGPGKPKESSSAALARSTSFGNLVVALLFLVVAPALGQLDVAGTRLHAVAQATRQILFNELYRVTLALPQGRSSEEALEATDAPKAFVVEVLYDGSAPNEVPSTWREELLPPLPEQDEAALRRAYSALSRGDRVTVTYAPDQGTSVYVNDRQILTDPGHELMGAFRDLWLGPNPVSDDLRRSLIADL